MDGCLVLVVHQELDGWGRDRVLVIEAELEREDLSLLKSFSP